MESINILGVKLDSVGATEALILAKKILNQAKQYLIVTVNAEFLVQAQKDKTFKTILNSANLRLVDSFGVKLMAKFFLGKTIERLTGADFFWPLVDLAATENKKMYFLGGLKGSAEKTKEIVLKKYPQAKIATSIGPYFEIKEETIKFLPREDELQRQTIQEINNFQPDVLLVAFGAPKQEYWLKQYLPVCPSVKLSIGVGGTFDFVANKIHRAPLSWRHLGLEWLWRLFVEPRRYKRIFNALIKFPYLCFEYYFIKRNF